MRVTPGALPRSWSVLREMRVPKLSRLEQPEHILGQEKAWCFLPSGMTGWRRLWQLVFDHCGKQVVETMQLEERFILSHSFRGVICGHLTLILQGLKWDRTSSGNMWWREVAHAMVDRKQREEDSKEKMDPSMAHPLGHQAPPSNSSFNCELKKATPLMG